MLLFCLLGCVFEIRLFILWGLCDVNEKKIGLGVIVSYLILHLLLNAGVIELDAAGKEFKQEHPQMPVWQDLNFIMSQFCCQHKSYLQFEIGIFFFHLKKEDFFISISGLTFDMYEFILNKAIDRAKNPVVIGHDVNKNHIFFYFMFFFPFAKTLSHSSFDFQRYWYSDTFLEILECSYFSFDLIVIFYSKSLVFDVQFFTKFLE